uniref:RanBD1 domain-containing protein n=1 Tax=Parastrongyloides trichosuri TaxID=131310 RepID=A0A0N5A2G6_PARTI
MVSLDSFKDKLVTLNKCFIDKLNEEYGKTPHADFTPCLMDYIKHLDGIDDICCTHKNKKCSTPSPKKVSVTTAPVKKPADNPLLKAPIPNLPPPEPIKSTKVGGKMKRKATTNIDDEMEEQTNGKNETPMTTPSSQSSIFTSPPTTIVPSAKGSSLFGGLKGAEVPKVIPSLSFTSETTPKDSVSSTTTTTNIFGKTTSSLFTANKDNKDVTKPNGISSFSFGTSSSSSEATNIKGKKSDLDNDSKDSDEKKETTKPMFSNLFGTSTTTTTNDSSDGSKIPSFNFTPAPVVPTKDDGNDEEDEPQEKYDPLQADKDALYNVKCALHQLVDKKYEKKGVAFINVKKIDGKKVLIVRATNAVGTILINTYINDNLKVVELEKTKIRLTFPNTNGTGMETWMVRVPGESDVEPTIKNLKP